MKRIQGRIFIIAKEKAIELTRIFIPSMFSSDCYSCNIKYAKKANKLNQISNNSHFKTHEITIIKICTVLVII